MSPSTRIATDRGLGLRLLGDLLDRSSHTTQQNTITYVSWGIVEPVSRSRMSGGVGYGKHAMERVVRRHDAPC